MKAKLVPLYFDGYRDEEFDTQVSYLKDLLKEEAEFCDAVALGAPLPECDAVVFPVLIGPAYRSLKEIQAIEQPILILTSEFGTVAMWDWEIISFLKSNGVSLIAPYQLSYTKIACRALALKRTLPETKFLVFQDNPGEGMQPEIFKRFYWWEKSWKDSLKERFGITIEERSYEQFAAYAKSIPDEAADKVIEEKKIDYCQLTQKALRSAVKIYIALKEAVEADDSIKGVGINCLNESRFSDTTPCLAYNLLYEEKGLIWACEGDTMTLFTQYIVNKTLNVPIMMTNIYPFLIGMAALKHEKIQTFPDVEDPDQCMLLVHCGYLGFAPRCMCTRWEPKEKALAIVDDNAMVVDAEIPKGDLTLVKIHPNLEKLLTVECLLDEYAQYPGSDCRNGAIIRVKDGHAFMKQLYSHHGCFITGHKKVELEFMADVLGLATECC